MLCTYKSFTWDSGFERPAGIKDYGDWKGAVYTKEQQDRLNVDENGKDRGDKTLTERAAVAKVKDAPPKKFAWAIHMENPKIHHCVELVAETAADNSSACFKQYWAAHGYQFSKYQNGLCPSDKYNFVNLKNTLCNSTVAGEEHFGVSLFTLGNQ